MAVRIANSEPEKHNSKVNYSMTVRMADNEPEKTQQKR